MHLNSTTSELAILKLPGSKSVLQTERKREPMELQYLLSQ